MTRLFNSLVPSRLSGFFNRWKSSVIVRSTSSFSFFFLTQHSWRHRALNSGQAVILHTFYGDCTWVQLVCQKACEWCLLLHQSSASDRLSFLSLFYWISFKLRPIRWCHMFILLGESRDVSALRGNIILLLCYMYVNIHIFWCTF